MLYSLHAQPEWVKMPALGNDTGAAEQPPSNSSAVICCCGCQVAQDVSLTFLNAVPSDGPGMMPVNSVRLGDR
jgi:hypothetical protein